MIYVLDSVKNIVGQGENDRHQHFHLFPHFSYLRVIKTRDCVVKKQFRILTTLSIKPFENIVGKGENAGNHNAFNPVKDKNHHFR